MWEFYSNRCEWDAASFCCQEKQSFSLPPRPSHRLLPPCSQLSHRCGWSSAAASWRCSLGWVAFECATVITAIPQLRPRWLCACMKNIQGEAEEPRNERAALQCFFFMRFQNVLRCRLDSSVWKKHTLREECESPRLFPVIASCSNGSAGAVSPLCSFVLGVPQFLRQHSPQN